MDQDELVPHLLHDEDSGHAGLHHSLLLIFRDKLLLTIQHFCSKNDHDMSNPYLRLKLLQHRLLDHHHSLLAVHQLYAAAAVLLNGSFLDVCGCLDDFLDKTSCILVFFFLKKLYFCHYHESSAALQSLFRTWT